MEEPRYLLTTKNYKTEKGEAFGYGTGILMMSPHKIGGKNVCPNASPACSALCLNTSGHGRYGFVQKVRLARKLFYFNEKVRFEQKLRLEIQKYIAKCERKNIIPVFRLNGLSDLPALAIKFAREFSDYQFYDYTKNFKTLLRNDLPANYHLTFSRSELNEKECIEALKLGFNVAVVFDKAPKTYLNHKVVTGEDSDLRFLDKYPEPVIIGLTAKGRARHDTLGFVVRGL